MNLKHSICHHGGGFAFRIRFANLQLHLLVGVAGGPGYIHRYISNAVVVISTAVVVNCLGHREEENLPLKIGFAAGFRS